MTDQLYKEFILDLYRHPLNRGTLKPSDAEHTAYNPTCGDEITITLSLAPDGTVSDVMHTGDGCAISIAAVSLMTEYIKKKDVQTIQSLTLDDVIEELGISIDYTREKCALIGLTAIQEVLQQIT